MCTDVVVSGRIQIVHPCGIFWETRKQLSLSHFDGNSRKVQTYQCQAFHGNTSQKEGPRWRAMNVFFSQTFLAVSLYSFVDSIN